MRRIPLSYRPERLWAVEMRAAIKGFKVSRNLGDYPTPDRAFSKNLRRYDPLMTACFNRVTDRWLIWKLCPSGWQIVMGVYDEKENYLPLGYHVLLTLAQMNVFQRGWAGLEEVAAQVRKERERERKHAREEDQYAAKQFAPTFKKSAEGLVGAVNVPKEDLMIPLKDRLKKAEIDLEVEDREESLVTA